MRTVFPVALLLGAFPANAGPERDLGATVRNNVVVQTIDPAPDYAGVPDPGYNGRRAADAMIRYQPGNLTPLLKPNGKSDLGGQGGAGDEPTVSIPLISSGPN